MNELIDDLSREVEIIRTFCLDNSYKIAAAESASAGFIQFLLSNMKEAGIFYNGGVTTYSCEVKRHLLHIPLDKCDETNGVSQEITDLMSENVSVLFKANIGIALTGYASAIPEQGIYDKFAFVSMSLDGEWILSERLTSDKESQCEVQLDFASQAIRECARVLSSRS
jgi:nicotinamide-nucleotide amidase